VRRCAVPAEECDVALSKEAPYRIDVRCGREYCSDDHQSFPINSSPNNVTQQDCGGDMADRGRQLRDRYEGLVDEDASS
jgi:hypothetical protein